MGTGGANLAHFAYNLQLDSRTRHFVLSSKVDINSLGSNFELLDHPNDSILYWSFFGRGPNLRTTQIKTIVPSNFGIGIIVQLNRKTLTIYVAY